MKRFALRPSFFAVYRNDDYFDIPPLKTEYSGEMNGGIDCTLDGKKIEIKIEEKKRAEEIQKEGEMYGKTTVLSKTSPKSDTIRINIGSLESGSECDITIHIEIISTNNNLNTYKTYIPLPEIKSKIIDFSFSISYNEPKKISKIEVKKDSQAPVKHEFDIDKNILSIQSNPSGPISILTTLKDEIPNVIQNDLNGEYSTVSVIPRLSSNSINSNYIFLVDCSGSMKGNPIKSVSECLLIFLHSLPIGCNFDIIKFGTHFKSIFDKGELVEYNESNLKIAEKAVSNLKADMHETNLLEPLVYSYDLSENESKNGRIVQIFILTDGRINNNKKVFDLVQKNRSKNRIFSVGIGSKVDKELVCGLSNLTFGNFDFVDRLDDMTDKVVNLLSSSLCAALTNVSIHALGEDGENIDSIEIVPNPLPILFNGQLMTFYVKRESKDKPLKTVLISGEFESEETEILIDCELKSADSSPKRLFAFYAINDYERIYNELSDDQRDQKEKIKRKIIDLSIENGILSDLTSFVGVNIDSKKRQNRIKGQNHNTGPRRKRIGRIRIQRRKVCGKRIKDTEEIMQDESNDEMYDKKNSSIDRGKKPCKKAYMGSRPNKKMSNQSSRFLEEEDEEEPPIIKSKKCCKNTKMVSKSNIKQSKPFSHFLEEAEASIDRRQKVCKKSKKSKQSFQFLEKEEDYEEEEPPKNKIQKYCPKAEMKSKSKITKFKQSPRFLEEEEYDEDEEEQPIIKSQKCCKISRMASKSNIKKSKQSSRFLEEEEDYDEEDEASINRRQKVCEKAKMSSKSNMENIKSSFLYSDEDDNKDDFIQSEKPEKTHELIKKVIPISITLTEIVKMQDFDGKWKFYLFDSLIDCISKQRNDNDTINIFNEFFTSLNIEENDSYDDIRSTIVAICVLNKLFEKENKKWKLIQTKAINWLNSMLKKDWTDEISKLLALI